MFPLILLAYSPILWYAGSILWVSGYFGKLLFVLCERNEGPVGTSGGDIRGGWDRACLDLLGSSSAPFLFRPEDLEIKDGSLWNI